MGHGRTVTFVHVKQAIARLLLEYTGTGDLPSAPKGSEIVGIAIQIP